MAVSLPPDLELQIKVSKILSLGFVFSITGLGGLGSLIAFIYGLRARKIIIRSKCEISGLKMAWWCVIAGALGMIVFPLLIVFQQMPQ